MSPYEILTLMPTAPEISIILPCRNEEQSIGHAIADIQRVLISHHVNGEIIVSDSSTDHSPAIAAALGARLIKHDQPGYGTALRHGLNAACAPYLFWADPDGSYDFAEILRFLAALHAGADLVSGNRLSGRISRGAMPLLHRYLGTPVLSRLTRTLFPTDIRDTQSGMRAITRTALTRLDLQSPGMEFASEVIIKAAQHRLTIRELPISYLPRRGRSKLRPIPDGVRHLHLIFKLAAA